MSSRMSAVAAEFGDERGIEIDASLCRRHLLSDELAVPIGRNADTIQAVIVCAPGEVDSAGCPLAYGNAPRCESLSPRRVMMLLADESLLEELKRAAAHIKSHLRHLFS